MEEGQGSEGPCSCSLCAGPLGGGGDGGLPEERSHQLLPEPLEKEVSIFYLVRTLLKVPGRTCADLLQKYGNPSEWVVLCPQCSSILEETLKINEQIKELHKQVDVLAKKLAFPLRVKVEGGVDTRAKGPEALRVIRDAFFQVENANGIVEEEEDEGLEQYFVIPDIEETINAAEEIKSIRSKWKEFVKDLSLEAFRKLKRKELEERFTNGRIWVCQLCTNFKNRKGYKNRKSWREHVSHRHRGFGVHIADKVDKDHVCVVGDCAPHGLKGLTTNTDIPSMNLEDDDSFGFENEDVEPISDTTTANIKPVPEKDKNLTTESTKRPRRSASLKIKIVPDDEDSEPEKNVNNDDDEWAPDDFGLEFPETEQSKEDEEDQEIKEKDEKMKEPSSQSAAKRPRKRRPRKSRRKPPSESKTQWLAILPPDGSRLTFPEVLKLREDSLKTIDLSGLTLKERRAKLSHIHLTHLAKKYGVQDFPCQQCEETFTTFSDWYDHKNKAHMEGFKCQNCGKVVRTMVSLENHYRSAHSDKSLFKCSACSVCFMKMDIFHEHLRKKDANPECLAKASKCSLCVYTLESEETLKIHMEVKHSATQKKPYQCPHCDKDFNFQRKYNQHVKSHTEDTSVVCDKCGVKCGNPDRLTIHIRNVHSGWPWQCKVCKRRFKSSKQKSRHEMLHTDKLEYLCNICGQAFKIKDYLRQHMQWSHGPNKSQKDVSNARPTTQSQKGKERISEVIIRRRRRNAVEDEDDLSDPEIPHTSEKDRSKSNSRNKEIVTPSTSRASTHQQSAYSIQYNILY